MLACVRAEAERKTSALLLSPPAVRSGFLLALRSLTPQKVEKGEETLRSQVAATLRALSDGLVERETEVRLLLLAAVCGEHLLLVGPPGTAKSELVRGADQTSRCERCLMPHAGAPPEHAVRRALLRASSHALLGPRGAVWSVVAARAGARRVRSPDGGLFAGG